MATESICVDTLIPASPAQIFEAWLDSARHAAMTGEAADIDGRVGGKHSTWGGYITGVTRALEKNRRIVQSWRSADFPTSSADSRIVVALTPEGTGTRVKIEHTKIPAGQGSRYLTGWTDFYFAPMTKYFARLARLANARAKPTAKAKSTTPKAAAPEAVVPKAVARKAVARKAASKKR